MSIGESVHSGGGDSKNTPASLTLGIVKDNWNTLNPGMVKVSISTPVDGEQDIGWLPVASPYAGNGCGFYMLPEIGSTAVIGYIDDNSVSPVVIGSVWSEKGRSSSKLPSGAADKNNAVKVFMVSGGHMIRINEGSESPGIEIVSGKKQSIIIDDKEMKVKIASDSSKCEIALDGQNGGISVNADSEISFTAGGNKLLKLSKSGLEINSDNIKIQGKSLDVSGSQTKISGSTVEVSAQGNLKVESSGMAQIKGFMLKLN